MTINFVSGAFATIFYVDYIIIDKTWINIMQKSEVYNDKKTYYKLVTFTHKETVMRLIILTQ